MATSDPTAPADLTVEQACADEMAVARWGAPIDWDVMTPPETWDAETLLVLTDGRQVREPQE